MNINALSLSKYKGAFLTDVLSIRKYQDRLEFKDDGNDILISFKDGSLIHPYSDDSDAGLCYSGYIAVSVVNAEPSASKVDDITFSI